VPAPAEVRRAVVDVHSHIYPQSYRDALSEAGCELPAPEALAGPEAKLAFMDERGIDRALVSLGNPWLDPFGAAGERLAAELNGELAGLADRSGGRLLGLGVLPHGSIEAAVRVASAVAADPGLYGLISGTRLCGRPLHDPRLEGLWEVLADTRLPLFVHPHHGIPLDGDDSSGSLAALALGFPLETTIALGRLVVAGVIDRFPGLRIVGAHCGGALPVLAGRLEAFWRTGAASAPRLARSPRESLSRLAFDAVGYSPAAVRAAVDLVGPDRVFFGTDHPFPIALSEASDAAIQTVLTGDDLDTVYGAAAEAFFELPPR
jgi:aminocarboxymuconate-semialdehyde decarboxylase